jgi:2-dehydropantoate 2-reductase
MRICVFGAGSLGSALGGILSDGNDVTLVGRRANMVAIRRNGLRIIGDRKRIVHLKTHETVKGVPIPDLLIIATKAFDTRAAVRACRGLVDNRTAVLTLQNGLGNLEQLREWRGSRAFGGTTTMGANLESPGVVRVSGVGKTVVGSDLDAESADAIASAMSACGVPTRVDPDITTEIWSKAVVNASINPTAAILRVRNGKLLDSKVISKLMRAVCEECECVANSVGEVRLPESLYPRARAVCRNTSKNLSSMLQDVLRGRRTEIAQINGAFRRAGDMLGLATPLNDALVAMISSLDAQSRQEKG